MGNLLGTGSGTAAPPVAPVQKVTLYDGQSMKRILDDAVYAVRIRSSRRVHRSNTHSQRAGT